MTPEQLKELTPAPWRAEANPIREDCYGVVGEFFPVEPGITKAIGSQANAEFIALARNAFDIMQRRQWTVTQWGYGESKGKWGVVTFKMDWPHELLGMGPSDNCCDDPFTALVEADAWHRENREKGEVAT